FYTVKVEFTTLSLHDALPIYRGVQYGSEPGGDVQHGPGKERKRDGGVDQAGQQNGLPVLLERRPLALVQQNRPQKQRCQSNAQRSEEHTSELQSRENLVCRLL